jgi:dTDP-4-dehydrorhamnose reductase
VRILVTGGSGLLGGRLLELLTGHQLVALRHRGEPPGGSERIDGDLARPGEAARLIREARAEAVVHAAALADVDACEADPAAALSLNARLPGELGRAAAAAGVRVVSISTDLVFDGSRAHWPPEAEARPLMRYGATKRAGERALLAAQPAAAVLRVALLVGRGCGRRASASEGLARAVRRGARPRLFTDQFRTPIDPESVAEAISRLLTSPGARGLFHAGGSERLSRYELGRRAAAAQGFDPDRLIPVPQAAAAPEVPRPLDASLDSSRLERELGWRARPLDTALRESRELAPD